MCGHVVLLSLRFRAIIRAYVEAQVARRAPNADGEAFSYLEAWAEWVRAQADELDPLRGEPPNP